MNDRSRYPGAQPFERNQKDIFFGREDDLRTLQRKIKLTPLTVLYGKSGYGKSSILNAGLIPAEEQIEASQCIRVRFNAFQNEEHNSSPLETTLAAIRTQVKSQHLNKIIPDENSLWRYNKEFYIEEQGEKGLLLIFDQFEELFTYPDKDILLFRQQLAEALYTAAPERYWNKLDEQSGNGNENISQQTLNFFQEAPNLKVCLAIRSDRLHLLEKLSDYIPLILKNLQELGPLDEQSAYKAITEPAIIKGNFKTPRFTYSPEALEQIMSFLSDDNTEPIESTQLQIICHHLERTIAATNAFEIVTTDVTQLDSVIENYYEEKIGLLQNNEQVLAAKRLIEEGLIFEEEERRLSIYEGQALKTFGLNKESLRVLVDSHLLRAEASMRGGYTYELSHDTLVPPILKAKKIRKAKEAEIVNKAAIQAQEQLLEEERRKRRRAYLLAGIGISLALVAGIAAFIAYQQTGIAKAKEQQVASQAFDLSMLLAKNYKIQGEYTEATNLLEESLQRHVDPSSAKAKQAQTQLQEWTRVQNLVVRADSLERLDSIILAIPLLEQADHISTDAYLKEKLEAIYLKRDQRVTQLLNLADAQLNINNKPTAALLIYKQALRLNSENQRIREIILELEN